MNPFDLVSPPRSGRFLALGLLAIGSACPASAQEHPESEYLAQAREVTGVIHEHFWNDDTEIYARELGKDAPAFMWDCGIMFSALVGAARHDPDEYLDIMEDYFEGMDRYWDEDVDIPGYEPVPTPGGGNDKYYDDNAWMVLTFLEAYELTDDDDYFDRAEEVQDFVMSGWDDTLGGGIWWHENHKGNSKNTCSNAPAAVGSLLLAKYLEGEEREERIKEGEMIVEWTTGNLRNPDGLYGDAINADTGEVNRGSLTYNNALMLRAYLLLHEYTGEARYLRIAEEIGEAGDRLLDRRTGAYRDPLKWSHLMVEADLELYRRTGERDYLERARRDADVSYEQWRREPSGKLIDIASLARELWLLADHETEVGREFWKKADRVEPDPSDW